MQTDDVVLVGSLRRESTNRMLATAIACVAPPALRRTRKFPPACIGRVSVVAGRLLGA